MNHILSDRQTMALSTMPLQQFHTTVYENDQSIKERNSYFKHNVLDTIVVHWKRQEIKRNYLYKFPLLIEAK